MADEQKTTDIVTRLREGAECLANVEFDNESAAQLCADGAAEIERLRAALRAIRDNEMCGGWLEAVQCAREALGND